MWQDDIGTLIALLGHVPSCGTEPVTGADGARLDCIAKHPHYVDKHELQRVMSDRPERVAIATAARSRMERVRIVCRATAAERVLPVHGQELWQLKTKSKGKRQLGYVAHAVLLT